MTTLREKLLHEMDLLSCPFCGSANTPPRWSSPLHWIECADCGACSVQSRDEGKAWSSWNRRAPPAGAEPVARVRQGATANIEWRAGMTYADLPAIDGQDLFTAAQVLAMVRVPPGWTAMPPEMDVSMYAAMGFWSQEGTLAACKAHASDRADTYRRLLAAAPRPPAAQANMGESHISSPPAAQERKPLFWVRLLRDGLYEGPVHANSVGGKMMRDEKPDEWSPLYLGSAEAATERRPLIARQLGEWHEDDGAVAWWAWCGREWAGEPAWIGTPNDSDWPGYHTHWTPHPEVPAAHGIKEGGSDAG